MRSVYLFVLLLTACLASCDVDTSSSPATKKSDDTKWLYSESEDRMTSKKNFLAENTCKDWIYSGTDHSWPVLAIQKTENGNNVTLSTGTFSEANSAAFYSGENGIFIRMRFDKERPIKFQCSRPADGTTNVIFIDRAKKVIAKLKKAKKLLIEATLVSNPILKDRRSRKSSLVITRAEHKTEIMEFNTAGLKWNH
ncbi:hypothetical protein [Mucilaginibacter sp. PAMB04168]|uniref:hypothetical protein n=1 Tax=Mucilaginibacter sp. PAMB04168 TaxID=3138567 RepID=UPI0031F71EC1